MGIVVLLSRAQVASAVAKARIYVGDFGPMLDPIQSVSPLHPTALSLTYPIRGSGSYINGLVCKTRDAGADVLCSHVVVHGVDTAPDARHPGFVSCLYEVRK